MSGAVGAVGAVGALADAVEAGGWWSCRWGGAVAAAAAVVAVVMGMAGEMGVVAGVKREVLVVGV